MTPTALVLASGQPGDASAGGPHNCAVGKELRGCLLDSLDILKNASQVQTEGAVGIRQVVGFQGVHHCGVLLDERCNGPGVQKAQPSCAIEVRFGGIDGSPGGLVPGKPEQLTVEILVQAEELVYVAVGISFRLAPEYYAKARNAGTVDREVTQGCAFDGLADKLGFGNPSKIHKRDEGTYLRVDLDQPFFPEQDQAFPHWRAADAQFLREFVFREGFARGELQGNDATPQRLQGLVTHGQPRRLSCAVFIGGHALILFS
jgi:hypothetical protein